MRLATATAACLLTVMAGLACAQPATVPAATQDTSAPEAAQTPPADATATAGSADAASAAAAVPATASTRTQTLRELGIDYEITLRGIHGNAGVPFGVRTDELVNQAQLHLRYSYSPALLPELSHLKVTVNGVTVATLPTPPADAGKALSADINIDPRVVSDYNQINLELIGHYTRDCEDPDHSSLWANIDAANSTLTLTTTPVPLADNLALLPVPFFDAHDVRPLVLPFVFAQHPDMPTLQAAGIVSSWFGSLAGYRGASFPVSTNTLPGSGNAVLFATPDTLPTLLGAVGGPLPDIHGPTLAVMANPSDPNAKLLLVLGRNAGELAKAATALALRTPLSGAVATLGDVALPAPRQPHDAPRWVSSERPVYFRELVDRPERLNVTGYHPDLIRVGLQLPPDLFVWRSEGIPMTLKYRYTVPERNNQSALNISINDAFVTTLPLNGHAYAQSLPMRWWRGLGERGQMPIKQQLSLPTGLFSANNQLRFHFFFDRPQADACKNSFPDVSAAIDPDSSIDLRKFPHYMAMPNLAAFGNAGFPFTRMADLSESAIVLPDNPGETDLGNVLTLLGKLGAATGYPTLRVSLATPAQAREQYADRDLIVLGSPSTQPLLRDWAQDLPVGEGAEGRRLRLSDWLLDKLPGFLSFDARRTDLPTTAEVTVRPQPDDVLMMGLQSPLSRGRSVVVLQADDPSNLTQLFEAWADPARLAQFQGSVVLLQQGKVTSLAGNQTYYIGHLPLPTWLRWYFSNHPIWLALGVVVLCLLLALAARVLLRMHSAIRLREGRGK
ncbi:MAG TPA: cellulose biosynthesis cyclic di-GMP-binding regulatory protein BcsB [Stenotrophomonas sp.]|nr:cellulose biosynthesis cyclic di-GMP-binding regulatory protein BcsB [Stenotrophomonas sp.]